MPTEEEVAYITESVTLLTSIVSRTTYSNFTSEASKSGKLKQMQFCNNLTLYDTNSFFYFCFCGN